MTRSDIAALSAERMAACRARLDCRLPQVDGVFADCLREAIAVLTPAGVDAYLDCARFLGRIGRGAEPLLAFLEDGRQSRAAL